jgi:hypothetical protein
MIKGLRDPITHCQAHLERWLPGAMFPSEVAWFLDHFDRVAASVLIECGRQDAVSTEMLGTYLEGRDARIVSIDFDNDAERARKAHDRVARLRNVELVTGDIHVMVPELIARYPHERIAILQDGPKGWEGLSTLLAAATVDNVVMVAQHNLHLGHKSRSLFQHIALHPAYIENSPDRDRYRTLHIDERAIISQKMPNRPIDHTSLGVLVVDEPQRTFITDSFTTLRRTYGPWNPQRVADAWRRRDYGFVSRLRKSSRYTLARFKAR